MTSTARFLIVVLLSLSPLLLMSVAHADEKDIWLNSKYEPTHVDMELKQVSPHVYYVQGPPGAPTDFDGFMSNAAVVITKNEIVVFDALGTPSLAYLLLSKIRAVSDKPIKTVIVSHYHADHIYGLQVFKELGAKIIAPIGAKDYLASDTAEGRLKERRESLFPWVNENTYVVKPDQYIEQVTTLSIGDVQLEIHPLGSTHSNGDQSVYIKPDRVLLAGDLMFEGRIPFVAGSTPQHWLENLKAIDPKDISVVVPGHGPASTHPVEAVRFTQDYLEYLMEKMGAAVEELTPFDEAYKATDWSRYEKMPAFQANRMNAYFMFLGLEAQSMK